MMIRIVSTTAVTAAKMIVLPQESGNGSSVTGATASVDANVGTPSVDVTMKEGKLNFTFKNLKGQKGDTGVVGAKGDKGEQGAAGAKRRQKAMPVQNQINSFDYQRYSHYRHSDSDR